MLTLYRRHKKGCPHADRYLKLDSYRCPVWVEGVLDGAYRRHSLRVSSWERAEKIRREMEEGTAMEPVSIDFALDAFLEDQKARALSAATLRKFRPLVARLKDFCTSHAITKIPQLDLHQLASSVESVGKGCRFEPEPEGH